MVIALREIIAMRHTDVVTFTSYLQRYTFYIVIVISSFDIYMVRRMSIEASSMTLARFFRET